MIASIQKVSQDNFTSVSLAEVIRHSRLLGADYDNDELTTFIKVAEDHFETVTQVAIVKAKYEQYLKQFPYFVGNISTSSRAKQKLVLHRFPVIDVESVQYYDNTDVLLSFTDYNLQKTKPVTIKPKINSVYPYANYLRDDAVKITFNAGYANAGAVPPKIKFCILNLVSHFYEHRQLAIEKTLSMIPTHVDIMLKQFQYLNLVV